MYLPEQDAYSISKRKLESNLSSLYGGRIAEEMTSGKDGVTTGASNDIERATEIAHNMVMKWGLSDVLGPMIYKKDNNSGYLGAGSEQYNVVSQTTQKLIDTEVRDIIDRNYARAETILKENEDILNAMADALMMYETIDAEQIKALMERREVLPPKDWTGPTLPKSPDDSDTPAVSPDLSTPAAQA